MRPWAALVLGVLVLAGFAALGDVSELLSHLGRWPAPVLLGVLALSLLGYFVRTLRWMLFLRRLDIRLPARESAHVFFAGLVGSITPAKIGEVLKSFLIETNHGVPIARTAPIVLAERVGDLLALAVLASVGVASTGYGLEVVAIAMAIAMAIVVAAIWPPVGRAAVAAATRLPFVRRFAPKLEDARRATQELFGTSTLAAGVALSLMAWGCEAVGAWWLITSLPGAAATLAEATFVFSVSTVAGALTFLPGGLLATEGSMVTLLHGVLDVAPDLATAGAITLMVRAVTLWFGVALGGIALSTYTRIYRPAGGQGHSAQAP